MEIIKRVFLGKTKTTFIQFIRYGFVAFISLVVDFGGLVLLKEVSGIFYLTAASISFVLGLIVNYLLSVLWVFHSSKVQDKKKEIAFFAMIGVFGLMLMNLILWFLTSKLGVYYMISKGIAVVLVYFWNFGMRKMHLFN